LSHLLISGGYGELNRKWRTLDTVTILGYPAYFLTIIGVWKVAAGVALLVPRFPMVKE
jgi:DoxX-like family